MVNYYKIKINGIKRKIASYDKILKLEQGYIANGADIFTDLQYLSALFINLGYNKCPSSIQQILTKDICDVDKTEVFDFRLSGHVLYLKDKDTLDNFINCIKIWIYGKSEAGYIIDLDNSFKLPDKDTIEYNLNNQIEIRRSLKNSEKLMHWYSTDYYTRRLHNLTSNINPMYFDKCIRKFKEYAKVIEIENCHILFKITLVNPDVVYSVIRDSEIIAAEKVNKRYSNYSALRSDYDTVLEFVNQLKIKLQAVVNIYNRNGLKGFLTERQQTNIKNMATKIKTKDNGEVEKIEDWAEKMLNNEEERMKYINEIKLDGEKKKKIYNLIDTKTLPPEMVWSKCCNSSSMIKRYKLCYENTMRRLYYVLEVLTYNYEDLDFSNSNNDKTKLSLTRPFYINPYLFSLYWKDYDMIFIVDDKCNITETGPKEAIEIYRNKYGVDTRLDPDDFNKESKEPESIKIIDDEVSNMENNTSNTDEVKNEIESNNDISKKIDEIYVKESEITRNSIISQDLYGKFGLNLNNIIKK